MDELVIAKLDQVSADHAALMERLADPDIASDHERYAELAKQAAELEETVRAYAEYRDVATEAVEARELLTAADGGEEKEFYRTAAEEAERRSEQLEARILRLLIPKDPRDDRPVIVEVRAGAGGDEAALFAGELLRLYQRYAEREGYKTEILEASEGAVGGAREVVFEVKGNGAFSRFRYESGVHRVQRVPETESSGRIHTSTVTVAVMPEADEVDVDIDTEDLRIDTYRASGPGGQHVNTSDTAVRITHQPSGIVVACQSERSQRQNKERAMRILLAKLQAKAEEEARSQVAAERRSQVGTGDRSEKIRTYNFPQNRVTDHRIGYSIHGIQQILDGEIGDLIDALRAADAEHAIA